MLDLKELGSRIRELRRENGLTQSEFAEKLCVSFQAVSNWERGIAPPELENLMRIASCFGVLVDELLQPRAKKLVMGIDGGGTKTEFTVVDLEGRVLFKRTKGASNPNDVGLQTALDVLIEGIREATKMFPSVTAVFCGIAGAATGENKRSITEKLKDKFPLLTVSVETDTANLFAIDELSDIAVISGTVSVVYVKHNGQRVRLGGWGYLFDSAGSAYDIGRDAIANALQEEDRRLERTELSKLLLEKINTETVWDAIDSFYKKGKPYIAEMAGVVFEAYKLGDKKAEQIIDANAKRIAELLDDSVRIYEVRPRAVAGGGIFTHYSDILLPHVKRYTDVEITVSDLPPVYGACREAVKLLGEGAQEEFYKNFKSSYGVYEK